jgi:hypothetical protein
MAATQIQNFLVLEPGSSMTLDPEHGVRGLQAIKHLIIPVLQMASYELKKNHDTNLLTTWDETIRLLAI